MADELIYMLRVADAPALHEQLTTYLGLMQAPDYVRLAVHAPLSNFGYDGHEGQLLNIQSAGLLVGHRIATTVPRLFVPWQNVAYLADGTGLVAAIKAEAEANEAAAG
ncbi:MAG TPA: hypothetical protein VGO93_26625 [Candidatus Xenobia bacterium]|jgi:hypothetical protein